MSHTGRKLSRDWGLIRKKLKNGSDVWYARIIRTDATGKKRQFTAKADNKTHARFLRDQLERTYDDRGERAIEGNKLRFRDLADVFEQRRLKPAQYHGTGAARRKVAGLRSLQPSLHYLRVLREHFDKKLVRAISHADVEDFKMARLKQPTLRGERSITDVNRSLELLRTILRFAARNGWIAKTPFEMGAPLISKSDEPRRERTLTWEEERRLLKACDSDHEIAYVRNGKEIRFVRRGSRQYLLALIVVAVDTGMRRGELLKSIWRDIDFDKRVITIAALNSKTARERQVGMTDRVFKILHELWNKSTADPEELVFGIKDNFKAGFRALLADANIEGLHFHDLRHTAITRMVHAGLPSAQIMKISGHRQWATFARYVNPDRDAVARVAEVLEEFIRAHTRER